MSDDSEFFTCEWLKSVGLYGRTQLRSYWYLCCDEDSIYLLFSNGVHGTEFPLSHVKTRRQVRDACAVFGVETNEGVI